ncbi:MAG: hypothetical protein AB1847_03680 [bacterium]
MKIVILSALGKRAARTCIDSLLDTIPGDGFDLFLVAERDFRERTLNYALSLAGVDQDILFVGDDIEFTPGWYDALTANYSQGDILGFGMLYPGTDRVQDRGYDLVQVDERITLEPKDRSCLRTEAAPFGCRPCDSVCGCLMMVKAGIFKSIPRFPEEGQNRWGEFIFMSQARKHGARVRVIDHYLYHSGKSTKSNPDKALSSTSYGIEKTIWKSIVDRYVEPKFITRRYRSGISEALAHTLNEAADILIYGAGTVCEVLLRHLHDKGITLCSGLSEEQGTIFCGYPVKSCAEAFDSHFDLLVITPLCLGNDIYRRSCVPLLQNKGKGGAPAIAVTLRIEGDRYIYDEMRLS